MVAFKTPNSVVTSENVNIPIDNTDFHYFALDPDLDTTHTLPKGGVDVSVYGTGDVNSAAGVALTTIDSAPHWSLIETGVDDALLGDNRGLTGLRLQALGTHAAVLGSVTQYQAQKITTKNK